ncbi:MAG TPA: hypothetical protein VEA59_02435 [Patescibacteria group bacterium]|nr:hypothetical protein [Patescibacteria group bacterium]
MTEGHVRRLLNEAFVAGFYEQFEPDPLMEFLRGLSIKRGWIPGKTIQEILSALEYDTHPRVLAVYLAAAMHNLGDTIELGYLGAQVGTNVWFATVSHGGQTAAYVYPVTSVEELKERKRRDEFRREEYIKCDPIRATSALHQIPDLVSYLSRLS